MSMRIIYAILLSILGGLALLLAYDHFTLKSELQRLVEIRDEYRTYTMTFRNILRDYQRLKEGDDTSGQDADIIEQVRSMGDEKKKSPFARDPNLTSKNGTGEKEAQFLIVNREPSYLDSSVVSYLKRHHAGNNMLKKLRAQGHIKLAEISSQARPKKARRSRRQAGQALVLAQLRDVRKKMRTHELKNLEIEQPCVKDINFVWPVNRAHFWLSSFYGARRKPDRSWGFHHGIDMAACRGEPTMAAAAGVVTESAYHKGFGNTIVVLHNNKYSTRYAHLHKRYVRVGQQVAQGQRIGEVGATGNVRGRNSGSHLHLEVMAYGKRVNPLYFFV